jgi:hypothetical protein
MEEMTRANVYFSIVPLTKDDFDLFNEKAFYLIASLFFVKKPTHGKIYPYIDGNIKLDDFK